MTATRYEYIVRWRRADWAASTKDNSRLYQNETAAQHLVRKLLNPPAYATDGSCGQYLSAAIVRVQRRRVGAWETVDEWVGNDAEGVY